MKYLLIFLLPALASAQRLEIGPGAGVDPIVIHTQDKDSGVIEIYIGRNSTNGKVFSFDVSSPDTMVGLLYYKSFNRHRVCGALGITLPGNNKLTPGEYVVFKYQIFRRKA